MNLVGVVIPSLSNMVFPEVMTGISETLEGTGLQPVVGVTNYLPDREEVGDLRNASAGAPRG